MKYSRLKLRHKLLLVLLAGSSIGLVAFVLVLIAANKELYEDVIPEHQVLHHIESHSTSLVQQYVNLMYQQRLASREGISNDVLALREELAGYSQMIAGQQRKISQAAQISSAIDTLEASGNALIEARASLDLIFLRELRLEAEIERAFQAYQKVVSESIAVSIETGDWPGLSAHYLPELRMIKSINLQILRLFLQIREFQLESNDFNLGKIRRLQDQVRDSSTMMVMAVENDSARAGLSRDILNVYTELSQIIEDFIVARQASQAAIDRVQADGRMLAETIEEIVTRVGVEGWQGLRTTLVYSGYALVLTLLASYLLVYIGLGRILGPLVDLQSKILRFGEGDLRQRVVSGTADEIGQLGKTFNHMADALEQTAQQKQEFISQLEQKNQELERFTYTVSHELKSPLVTVGGFLGLLKKDLLENNQDFARSDMNKIETAVKLMNKQLDDLLELSRIGRQVNPPQNFSLGALCREVVDMMHGSIQGRGAKVEIDDDMPDVFADQVRISEVIQNLLENAIKFCGTTVPRIHIGTEPRQDMVLCRICDNGPGIDPRYHEKVFELFDRLDNSVPGTGIGLALVKRIVEVHGGRIWIESEGNGQGACFCFTLPREGDV